jgi:hypothetical protein
MERAAPESGAGQGGSGEAAPETTRDPTSGYASGDALDPEADVNRARSGEPEPETTKDPMSGYASGDALEPRR